MPGDMLQGYVGVLLDPYQPRPDQRVIERISCYRNDSRDKDEVLTIIAACLACFCISRRFTFFGRLGDV